MLLLLVVIEIKVKIYNCLGRVRVTMVKNIFDDRGAQNRFSASRNTMEPEKRVWIRFPMSILFALGKPSASSGLPFFECFAVVQPWIWC